MKIKKFFSLCLATIMCFGIFALVGCSENNSGKEDKSSATTIMHASINPEVEFILDGKGNVLTVNATNEDGNLIVSSEAFANVNGKSAKEAAQLFVKTSKDMGFLISGRVNEEENKVEFSFFGDIKKIDRLFQDVKAKVEAYLSAENVKAQVVKAEAITKEELEKILAECEPYLKEAEIKAMEYKEILKKLAESRKETAKLYSEELKNAYYQAKEFAFEHAKLETIRAHLTVDQRLAFDVANELYKIEVKSIAKIRNAFFVGENSLYQHTLSQLREKKSELLDYKQELANKLESEVNAEMLNHLQDLEEALEITENAFEKAKESAEKQLDQAEELVEITHTRVLEKLSGIDINAYAEEISEKQTNALNTLFTEFEKDYAVAKNSINNKLTEFQNKVNNKKIA